MDWENISYAGLTHLNTYAKDKLINEHPNGLPFVALASYWAECLSPAIPDGRYVKRQFHFIVLVHTNFIQNYIFVIVN